MARPPLTGGKAKEYKDGKFLVNPLTFLDKNCKYGFKNTAYWLDLRYKHRALIKAELELEKAAKEMLSDTDKLRVYRKWETRFKNKRLPEALELFYGTMANIQKPIGELTATQ
ncbi:MAG TPA: hypothetical protein VEC12_03460 [Bacteroidia bacterium]|nr:hypothetical protein [Bacteroidia bacterium]